MVWMYNSRTGAVQTLLKPAAELLMRAGIGWHGTFLSKAQALAFYEANKGANPGWKAPTDSVKEAVGNLGESAVDVVKDAADDLNPWKGLNLQSFMIRIGEILLGLVLLGVGIAKLTGTGNPISKLAKVAL